MLDKKGLSKLEKKLLEVFQIDETLNPKHDDIDVLNKNIDIKSVPSIIKYLIDRREDELYLNLKPSTLESVEMLVVFITELINCGKIDISKCNLRVKINGSNEEVDGKLIDYVKIANGIREAFIVPFNVTLDDDSLNYIVNYKNEKDNTYIQIVVPTDIVIDFIYAVCSTNEEIRKIVDDVFKDKAVKDEEDIDFISLLEEIIYDEKYTDEDIIKNYEALKSRKLDYSSAVSVVCSLSRQVVRTFAEEAGIKDLAEAERVLLGLMSMAQGKKVGL